MDQACLTYATQSPVTRFLATFAEFPPRMKPAGFTIDQVMTKAEQSWSHQQIYTVSVGAGFVIDVHGRGINPAPIERIGS